MARWLSLGFSVFVAALGTLWFMFVRAPSPDEVCAHKIELVQREAGDADAGPLIQRLHENCITNAQRRMQMRGKIKYANYARCVTEASSLEAAERCSSGS